jgi:hypothetical protein
VLRNVSSTCPHNHERGILNVREIVRVAKNSHGGDLPKCPQGPDLSGLFAGAARGIRTPDPVITKEVPARHHASRRTKSYRDSRSFWRLITRPAIRHSLQVGSEAGMGLSWAPSSPATLRALKRPLARLKASVWLLESPSSGRALTKP